MASVEIECFERYAYGTEGTSTRLRSVHLLDSPWNFVAAFVEIALADSKQRRALPRAALLFPALELSIFL